MAEECDSHRRHRMGFIVLRRELMIGFVDNPLIGDWILEAASGRP